MNNIVNRINNEFNFNYQKFVKNNNIAKINTFNTSNNFTSKFNNVNESKPVEVETMDFYTEKPKEKTVEVLELDK